MLPGGDGHFCKVDFRRNFVISHSRCWVHLSTHEGCVCVVRSDMSQLCSCSPLAQAWSCPRRLEFSSAETNLIPFLTAWGLLQDVSRELRQAKWGWWIRGGNTTQQCSVVSSSHKPFCCHIPSQWPEWTQFYPCCPGSLTLTQPSLRCVRPTCHSGTSQWSVKAAWEQLELGKKIIDYIEISIFVLGFNHKAKI